MKTNKKRKRIFSTLGNRKYIHIDEFEKKNHASLTYTPNNIFIK